MGLAGWSLAFALGEMGAVEGLEKSGVTRLNTSTFTVSLAPVWRRDAGGTAKPRQPFQEVVAISRRGNPGARPSGGGGQRQRLNSGNIL